MDRVRNLMMLFRGQIWVIPTVLSALALALAAYLLGDGGALLSPGDAGTGWLYGGDAGSARELLSSLLSGLMTMTSLVVSMTFIVLTLAANQLGPRLISTFVADRQIQTVLGVFLGTILYVLVVLRSLDDEPAGASVPHFAVTVGSALTIVCLFTFLFYLHKVARSIVADNVIATVARDLSHQIRDILPEPDEVQDCPPPPSSPEAASLSVGHPGYIQTIDYHALVGIARRKGLVLDVAVRAGHFLLRHGDHVLAHPGRALDAGAVDAIRSAFVMGQERTPAQDLEYSIRQLVEIAVRALSPAVNDPFTAIAVVDRLGAAMEQVLTRSRQPMILRDEAGEIRVVARRSDIRGLADAAFDQIRQAGSAHPAILIRMADMMGQLAPVLAEVEARRAVLAHLDLLGETARQGPLAPTDREDVMKRIASGRAAIERRALPAGDG